MRSSSSASNKARSPEPGPPAVAVRTTKAELAELSREELDRLVAEELERRSKS